MSRIHLVTGAILELPHGTKIKEVSKFEPSIIVGIIGIALVGCAYPIYNHITQKEREKIAPEIIRLTDELMK